MLSKSSEEYLKNIYLIKQQNGNVRITDIANKMKCTKPSVNKAIYILRDNLMVTNEPYGEIQLTKQGENYAQKIIAAYDIVYLFLTELLGIDKELAHEQAEKMKASMSDNTLNKLAKYVHIQLNIGDPNCAYDLNKETCRACEAEKIKRLV